MTEGWDSERLARMASRLSAAIAIPDSTRQPEALPDNKRGFMKDNEALYDPKCDQLARYFLNGNECVSLTDKSVRSLAIYIQESIEAWIDANVE